MKTYLKMLLDLVRIHGCVGELDTEGGGVVRALVHVGEEEGGADGGAVVDAGATLSMPACPDLEVEGAVNAVLLRAEYGSQVLRHS